MKKRPINRRSSRDKKLREARESDRWWLAEFGLKPGEGGTPWSTALFFWEALNMKKNDHDPECAQFAADEAKKYLFEFALDAMQRWDHKAFVRLAKAMRRFERGELTSRLLPHYDGLRAELVAHHGNVDMSRLAEKYFPRQEIELAKRSIRRIKARIFGPDK